MTLAQTWTRYRKRYTLECKKKVLRDSPWHKKDKTSTRLRVANKHTVTRSKNEWLPQPQVSVQMDWSFPSGRWYNRRERDVKGVVNEVLGPPELRTVERHRTRRRTHTLRRWRVGEQRLGITKRRGEGPQVERVRTMDPDPMGICLTTYSLTVC